MPLIYNGIFYLRNCLFKSGTLFSMLKKKMLFAFAGFVILIGLAAAIYQIPAIKNRLEWRLIVWSTYVHNTIDPVGKMPTPLPSTPFATFTPVPFTPTSIGNHTYRNYAKCNISTSSITGFLAGSKIRTTRNK